ncbi:uncharacterized protein PpBr36_06478 [Pyricularia pennisetigena]|uniref:uncharacterized protein n=1 Tax=Pyricularia pennisetigena TaxID=1578925 RepID=UPI00114D7202|nr:uncharacterized protein PpBr36_06478 [Pyricularia pennisetigena]TLS22866.1 hypothetical protein PpBr36_06478 [Pyricularia pennisetigena]
MSFAVRRVALASRTAAVSTVPRASFTTGSILNKTPTESVKDGLKKVDRVVSDKLVDGINVAANVGQKAKEVTEDMTSSDAAKKASELAGEAQGKASQMAGQAQGKASEMAGQAQGKASEMAGQAKGKAAEVQGQAQGKAEEVKRNM